MRILSAVPFQSVAILALGLLLTACPGKDDPKPATTNNVTLEMEHRGADGNVLTFGRTYQNALGQPYKLNQLVYYVSNVKLTKADGTVWAEPKSYHLVKVLGAPNNNPKITLADIPFGNYTKLTMSFGVDSVANSTADHDGDLNPSNGMATWDWHTGYRFMVMEGEYQPTGAASQPLIYHIGTNRAYRLMELPLPTAATVTSGVAPSAHTLVDVNAIFGGANKMDFTKPEERDVQSGPVQVIQAADNIKTIFQVEHVHND